MKSRLPSVSVFLLSTVLTIAVALPLQAQTAESYVPALQASDGADLGLALVNPTLTEARVTVTARSYNGAIIQNDGITSNPVTLTLPASGQIALRAAELFGTGISGQAGWVEISASTPAVRGFFLAFDSGLSFIDGAELAKPAKRLIFPKVSGATSSPTELSLVNTTSQDIQGSISLFRNDGQLFAARSITIPALSGFTSSIEELVPSAIGFEGYTVIDAGPSADPGMAGSLIGFETYRNRSDIALIRAFPESARLRTGFLAHLASQGGYSTSLTLVNFSSDTQVLQIAADGLQVGGSPRTPSSVTVQRTLPPNARLEERVDQMFNLSGEALIDGYIRFETQTNTPGVIGFLDYGTTDGIVLSAVEAQGEGYSNLFFSHVAEGAGYYTGLALLNPNSEPSIVTLDTFDAAGNRTGSTIVNLNSGEREARLLSEFLQHQVNQLGGYIRLTATRPIFAFELFGSRDSLSFLASVPAQGESLKPQTSGRMVDASQGANVISSDGSTSLLIPPKALKSNAAIKVAPISAADLPLPAPGQQPIAAVEATPAGTQFEIPVRLTFPVNADLDPGTQLPLLIFDPETRTYQPTEFVATVDKSGRTASAEVTHFTQYVAAISAAGVTVSGISPSTVSVGDTITITGTSFSNNKGQTKVTFEGANNTSIQGTTLSASTTSIEAVVPTGAVTGLVIVRIAKQSSNGYPITVLGSSNPAPGTISISPSTVMVGTSPVEVQIAGTAFLTNSMVNYDGASMTPTFVDNTLLKVTLGTSTAAIHKISVVNPAPGGGTSNVVDFTVTAAPSTPDVLSIVTPLKLDKTLVNPGQTLNATVTYKNTGASAITVSALVIAGRPPGGSIAGGPWADLSPWLATTTVQPGATLQLSASRPFTSSDPIGTWYAFATYEDASLVWRAGPTVNFTVSASSPATNQPPTVSAGPNQTITLPASANLSGTVNDDGLPTGSTVTQTWSKVSGVGTVAFGSATSWSTSATFSVSGSYLLRLTASDGALSSSADVTITVNSTPPPSSGVLSIVTPLKLDKTTVNSGDTLNATVTYKNTGAVAVTVNALVIAGRPPGGTIVGGPWADLSPWLGVTTVQPGATLVLSASRPFTSSDPAGTWYAFATYEDASLVWNAGPPVDFTVSAPAPGTNQPPTVNAGPGQTITLPSAATLSGTASDDGLPAGSALTTTWSKFSGPGTVTFGNVNASNTTATFSTSGTYVLRLSASDSALTTTGDVSIVANSGSSGSGTTYYVSNSGNDSNSGSSQSSPWKTIGKVQNFLGSLRGGDSVLFQRGGIWYEALDLGNVNGSTNSRITIGNYGTGNLPIIDGGGSKSGNSINGGRQWCMGTSGSKISYVTVDGFECRMTSSYGIAFVNVSTGSAGVIVQNSYIHDTGNGDFGYHNQLMFADYNGSSSLGFDGTKFLNNKVGNCFGHNCIEIHGDRGSPLIQGNECYAWSHNCIDLHYAQGALVDSNVVHDGLGVQFPSEAFYLENGGEIFWGSTTADVTWTRNTVYGGGFNAAFQCGHAGGPVTCYVYNNTVYGNADGAFGGHDFAALPKVYVKNNIFDTPSPSNGDGFVQWDYNVNVQGGSVPSISGSHDMTRVNPQYMNAGGHDFHLQSGSPVIDKGTNVNLSYTGGAPDMGAFEYGSGR